MYNVHHKYRSLPLVTPICLTSNDIFFHAFFWKHGYYSQAVAETFVILQNLFSYVYQTNHIIKLFLCLRENKGYSVF